MTEVSQILPDRSHWSAPLLLERYGEAAVLRHKAIRKGSAGVAAEIQADMSGIAHEIGRRIQPGARDRAAVKTLDLVRSQLEMLLEDVTR